MHLDVRGGADMLLGRRYLKIVRTDEDAGEWHECQVTADEAFFNRAELGLVGLHVDVHVFELADLVSAAVDEHFPMPLGGDPFGLIIGFGHPSLLVFWQTQVKLQGPRALGEHIAPLQGLGLSLGPLSQ